LIVDSPRRPPLESRVLSHGHHHGDSHANHRQQQPTCAAVETSGVSGASGASCWLCIVLPLTKKRVLMDCEEWNKNACFFVEWLS